LRALADLAGRTVRREKGLPAVQPPAVSLPPAPRAGRLLRGPRGGPSAASGPAAGPPRHADLPGSPPRAAGSSPRVGDHECPPRIARSVRARGEERTRSTLDYVSVRSFG